jgi:hypothetical protein
LLEVGHLSDVSGKPKRASKLTTELIKSIYNANSPLENILKRDLLFAARAVADVGKLGMAENLRQDIADSLVQLWKSIPIEMQKEECEALFSYSAQTKLGDLMMEKLVALTEDANKDVRRSAAFALGKMGQGAASTEVIKRLVVLTEDADEDVRRSVAEALKKTTIISGQPDLAVHLVLFWKSRLSDRGYDMSYLERTNDIAYCEISKIVSQFPLAFNWEEGMKRCKGKYTD